MRLALPLLLLPLILAGCVEGTAEIVVEPGSLDFGEVQLTSSADLQLTVTNQGTGAAVVTFAVEDGPFDVALSEAVPVGAGESRFVYVTARPTALGTRTDVLEVSWEGGLQEVGLSVTGVLANQTDADGDGYPSSTDCDDTDPDINPLAEEVCDGVDNDCSGEIDDTVDADDDGSFACEDCDDADPGLFPGNPELCDGLDQDCDGDVDEGFDADGDGFTSCGDDADCDDTDPNVQPDADELCNGLDDDCDGAIDEGFEDSDGDGEPACTDCDDAEAAAHHGALELCDGIDNDCDGSVDENGPDVDGDGSNNCHDCDDSDPTSYPGAEEVCDGADNNCDGQVDEGVCGTDDDGDGHSVEDGDCDDSDAAVFPGATELCNAQDDDCDAELDEGFDGDADGVTTCGADGQAGSADDDCDDASAASYPGAPELCDGLDNDCDGAIETLTDGDGDTVTTCAGDCDDADPNTFPGALEVCDGADNDCSGAPGAGEVDGDGDGSMACAGDCDDADAAVFPGATEACNGADDDCSGAPAADEADADADGTMACDGDCDDADAATYPGAPELCDGADNDCDGSLGADELDGDGDGVTPCDGDCDDADAFAHPGATELCSDGVDLDCDGVAAVPCTSCLEALDVDPGRTDGYYQLDTDGSGPLAPFLAQCDMTTDGGGWTLIMRTTDDGAANLTLVTDYASLHDVAVGTANSGAPMRVPAAHWEALATQGDMMSSHALRKADGSSCDRLHYGLFGGVLTVAPGTSAADTVSYAYLGNNDNKIVTGASPAQLSAADLGPASSLCVQGYAAVPWFYVNCSLNLPAIAYNWFPATAPEPVVRSTVMTVDLGGLDVSTVCGGETPTGPASGWYSENVHDYWLR